MLEDVKQRGRRNGKRLNAQHLLNATGGGEDEWGQTMQNKIRDLALAL